MLVPLTPPHFPFFVPLLQWLEVATLVEPGEVPLAEIGASLALKLVSAVKDYDEDYQAHTPPKIGVEIDLTEADVCVLKHFLLG